MSCYGFCRYCCCYPVMTFAIVSAAGTCGSDGIGTGNDSLVVVFDGDFIFLVT